METLLFWILIWFNAGLVSQLLLATIDGLLNRRWPFRLDDARHYMLSGIFGFFSVVNLVIFMIQFSVSPEKFEAEDDQEDNLGSEDKDKEVMYIVGLTEDEQKKVEDFIHGLIEERPKGEKDVQ